MQTLSGLVHALDDGAHLPGRVLEPDDALGIDDDDVLLAVAVDIDEQDRVADVELFVDFLHAEGGERLGGHPGRQGLTRASQEERSQEPGKVSSCSTLLTGDLEYR